MKKNDLLKALLIMFLTLIISVGAMFALNLHTGPLIEQNNQGAELAPLKAVMPDAAGFEVIYDKENPSASSLKDVDAAVIKIYKETSGKGFVFRVSAVSQYTKGSTEYTIGVTSDGKITKVNNDVYSESQALVPGFLDSFTGKDSALPGVEVTGGTTYSSKALKAAVESGLNALINNDLIKAGVKSDAQILSELIPTVFPGITSEGALKADAFSSPTGNIESGYIGQNGAGCAFIMKQGEERFLAVCNNLNACKVYNKDGADVTAEHADLVTEALDAAKTNAENYYNKAVTKFTRMMAGATNFASIDIEVFETVVAAVKFEVEGSKYYGFYSKSFGFEIMDVYYVLDSEGKIVKMTADTLIFHEEYFTSFEGIPDGYQKGFIGNDSSSFDENIAIIAGATMTSNAMKKSTKDIFAAFDTALGGAE